MVVNKCLNIECEFNGSDVEIVRNAQCTTMVHVEGEVGGDFLLEG